MLLLGMCCLFILVVISTYFISFMIQCYRHSQHQNEAEPAALQVAEILNKGNSVGEINGLSGASRHMVYASSCAAMRCSWPAYKAFSSLANDIHARDRESFDMIEDLRKEHIRQTVEAVLAYVSDFNHKRRSNSAFDNVILPTNYVITDVDLGCLNQSQSSAYTPDALPNQDDLTALQQYDEYNQLIDHRSGLYMAKLVAAPNDPDLQYRFSVLPAQVCGTVAPARTINPRSFRYICSLISNRVVKNPPIDEMPTAVRLTIEFAEPGSKTKVQEVAYAVSDGAHALPWESSGYSNENR